MTKYYSIAKGTDVYDYLDRILKKDTDAFLDEVTGLIGFEANKNIGINRSVLIIQKNTLEKFKPEWLSKFKRYQGEWLTPKVAMKELISSYAELREKYNMDMEFRTFCWNYGVAGKVEVIYDFDNSGFAYFKSNRDVKNSAFVELSEVKYLEREAELLAREIARKKEAEGK
ncbi:hypothetical protein [Listeria monocytogenes]|uniref:hypothetical protein n=1 Tax=Listeria monocytogenes TaxID=1639 RepID=UPI000BDF8EB5|nr:hypothetical protein [Listeria monocytogenes]PCT95660.1 hypothetical protein A7O90_07310 [Listeria monocytogenes]HAB0003815.1 hypothetical protein [Listeria monocytogenes]HAC2236515.1 hypothetical protein [Listeria monocytogenes]